MQLAEASRAKYYKKVSEVKHMCRFKRSYKSKTEEVEAN